MPSTEEEQVQAMLDAIGVDTVDQIAETVFASIGEPPTEPVPEPVPAAPVAAPVVERTVPVVERAASERRGVSGGRDVTISTLVHLLGVSTANQVSVLEAKVDELTAQMSLVLSKLERMNANLQQSKSEATLDRVDYQLSDLRALLKKVFPKLIAGVDLDTPSGDSESRPKVLSSGSSKANAAPAPSAQASAAPATAEAAPVQPPPSKPAAQKDALEEFESADDSAFQSAEGRRIRSQTSQGVK